MAITRRFQTGLELGVITEFSGSYFNGGGGVVIVGPKTGTYCFQGNSAGGGAYAQVFWILPATRQIRTGFYWNPESIAVATEVDIVQIKTATGTILVRLEATGSGAGNNLIIDVAGTNRDTEAGASSGSSYMHIGIDVKIHSSAGWVVVYKDGVEILRFEGNTGDADIGSIFYGHDIPASVLMKFDDFYVDDTTGEAAAVAVPASYFQLITLNGNGNYNGNWDGSDGNSVDNYLLVDEIPPVDDVDYIQTSVADELESFAMTTFALAVGQEIQAIIPIAYCKKFGITEQIALGTRLSGTDSIGADQAPSQAYSPRWERQATKPGGGAWDQAALDGVELVVKSRGTF
jgi:hypothetical protein